MVVYEINFVRIITDEIHERALQKNTTIPFSCLIFQLCRESTVPFIDGLDNLIEVTRTQDVGLIKDDTNPIAQWKAPRPKVRLLEMFEGPSTDLSDDRFAPRGAYY